MNHSTKKPLLKSEGTSSKLRSKLKDGRFNMREAVSLFQRSTIDTSPNRSQKYSSNIKLPQINGISVDPPSKQDSKSPSETEEDLSQMLKIISKLWSQKKLPKDLLENFNSFLSILPRQKAFIVLNAEIKAIKENVSNVQTVLKSIKNREESLKSINDLNSYLESTDWLNLKEVHLQCAELLHGHRLFTLNVVESIVKWKESLNNTLIVNNCSPKFSEFVHEGVNYLVKIKNDLDFLKSSQFSKILNFASESDPLLISPSIPVGKKERGRKRDPNYFIDDGQVIVPIPSFLTARVKEAEEIIIKESETVHFMQENTPEKQAAIFSVPILEDLIEEQIKDTMKVIVLDVSAYIKEQKIIAKAEKNKNKLQNDIFKSLIHQIAKEQSQKIAEEIVLDLQVQQNKLTIGQVSLDLSEKLSNDFLTQILSDICEEELKDYEIENSYELKLRAQKIDHENNELSKKFNSVLLTDFLYKFVTEIAKETVNEIRKKNEEENSMYLIKSPLIEEIGYDFAGSDQFLDISDLKWVPLKLSEELITDVLYEYYSISPEINNTILPSIENLLSEINKGMDTCWYWAVQGSFILGFMVYSVDCSNKAGRKLNVHHISSLNWNSFPIILQTGTQHILKIDTCDEIRINLFIQKGFDMENDVKKIFTQQGYRWKTKNSDPEFEIIVLGKLRKEKSTNPPFFTFNLKTSVVMNALSQENSNNTTSNESKEVGNRQNMLQCLLGLFGDIEAGNLKLSTTAKTKLQGVITNLLKQMNDTQCFSFPFMQSTASKDKITLFLTNHNIKVPSLKGRISASILDLKFRWISCTNVSENIRGQQYRFLRFKSSDIKTYKSANFDVYFVPTEMPEVQAFFIYSSEIFSEISKEFEQNKLDLFSFTEKLIYKDSMNAVTEVWVPCFKKSVRWEVPWMQGYEIPAQSEEKAKFVDKCFEEIKVDMGLLPIPEGLLNINNKYGPVLVNDFVFGLTYTKGDRVLDIPLFSCLVTEKDWVKTL